MGLEPAMSIDSSIDRSNVQLCTRLFSFPLSGSFLNYPIGYFADGRMFGYVTIAHSLQRLRTNPTRQTTASAVTAKRGTLTAGRVRDLFGSYNQFFYVTAGLAVVGIVLAVSMLKRSPSTSVSTQL